MWCERKSEIQDGYQRENTNISAFSIQHNCTIPKATLIFSRMRNSIKPFPILGESSGREKSKMAAHKPEIFISQPVYNITAKFDSTAAPRFTRSIFSMKLFHILCNASESWKFKMAAHKKGKIIYQLANNDAAQIQRLYTCISMFHCCWCF